MTEPRGLYVTGEEAEWIATDPETGGSKGRKLAQLSALDPVALYTLAEVAGAGAQQYGAHNFLKGYPWSSTIDAAQRHLLKLMAGEDFDPKSGQPHAAHLAWHALALTSFLLRGLGTDDRYKGPLLCKPESPTPTPDQPATK